MHSQIILVNIATIYEVLAYRPAPAAVSGYLHVAVAVKVHDHVHVEVNPATARTTKAIALDAAHA